METNNKMTELSKKELTEIFAGQWKVISYIKNGVHHLQWVKI